MENKEIEKYLQDFSKEYGELLGLKANIAAINKMLIDRNRGEELFSSVKEIVDDFKEKHKSNE